MWFWTSGVGCNFLFCVRKEVQGTEWQEVKRIWVVCLTWAWFVLEEKELSNRYIVILLFARAWDKRFKKTKQFRFIVQCRPTIPTYTVHVHVYIFLLLVKSWIHCTSNKANVQPGSLTASMFWQKMRYAHNNVYKLFW